jgi:hypothetical protein
LLGREKPSRTGGRAARLARQSRPALFGDAAADIEHAGPGQADLHGNGRVSQAALAQSNHLPPTLFLRCCGQLAHVHMLHPADLGRLAANFKITQAGSIASGLSSSGGSNCST